MTSAIRWRDYPMVQNLVMFIALVVVVVNLIVDLAYMFVDPRIRYGE
jgi:peptide/nickel transport system permease protein